MLYLVYSVSDNNPGDVAQWLEQSAHNRLVAGSNPAIPTIILILDNTPIDLITENYALNSKRKPLLCILSVL
jgi:hypothetical protein